MVNSYLYHHGIKGMRWGVRRYQNPDGTLTKAGKKHYYNIELLKQKNDVDLAKKAKKESGKNYDRAYNRYSYMPTNKNFKLAEDAQTKFKSDSNTYKRLKLKYKTNKEVARIKEKDIQIKSKSKHRLKLEEQYKKMGMNDEQAQAAANNRIRTEKILVASAALTVTACAAYVTNKKLKSRVDGIIKAGETLQRVEMQDTDGKLHDVFYAAKGKHDTKRYENLLGLARKQQTGHAYLMKLEAASDIKVASKDKAAKTFGDLYKNDSEFRNAVKEHIGAHFNGSNKIKNTSDMSNKNIKKMYENFNANIGFVREGGSGADKKFYSKLKSAGYGAIQDINDMKYSGYNAKNPLIVFDNSKSNVMVKSVREMTGDLNKRGTVELLKATGESLSKDFLEKAGPLSAAALTTATVTTYRSDPSTQYSNSKKSVKWN